MSDDPPIVTIQVRVGLGNLEATFFAALTELTSHKFFDGLDTNAKARCANHLAEMHHFVEEAL